MGQSDTKDVYLFLDFTLDIRRRTLVRDGLPVPLAPKEFLTLALLVEADGQAVSKETLISAVWPDTIVGDTSLARNISSLRRHLGIEAIEVVPKFGYRFTPEIRRAPVAVERAPAEAPVAVPATPSAPSPPPARLRAVMAGTGAALTVAALALFLFHHWQVNASTSPLPAEAVYWNDYGTTALHEGAYFKASKAFEHAQGLATKAAVVHLHLAQDWFLMDFVENAQKEVLIAESASGHNQLSPIDRLRVDALRAMLVQDYPTAVQSYKQAVAQAPDTERAMSLEDLGLAYQRQGLMDEAAQSFAEAASLAPTNPGPQLDLGKLDALQRRWTEANQHFDRAEQLFEAGTDLEGTAEVNYQRALISYVQADYHDAESFLERSLAIANSLNDENMRLRSIGALSTIYRWDGKLDLSASYAKQVTEAGARSGSLYFYAEGIVLQANVAVARHDQSAGRSLLQQAADLAARGGNARQQANAEFTLAQFSGDTGDYAQEIAYADRALAHYRSYGSVDGAADAFLLRIQGEARSGDLPRALADAQALLASSQQTHSDLFTEDTEEELGEIYSAMKNEPEALVHFLRAQDWSHRNGSQPELKALHVAGSYARLGEWKQARAVWAKIPPSTKNDPDCTATYAEVQALMKGK